MMNVERAIKATQLMWWRLGRIADGQALHCAANDSPTRAVRWAKMADVFYYQATGEGDAISMREIS